MKNLLSFLLFISLFIFSCDKEKEPYGKLVFQINHKVDSEDLQLNQRIYLNEADNQYEVVRLRYVLSDFVLETDSGLYKIEETHFYDVEEEGLVNTITLEADIPFGSYKLSSFVFGLDSTKNTSNAYINEPWHLGFAWPDIMGGGYHYMQFEGFYDHSDGTTNAFITHRGRALDNITLEPRESFTVVGFANESLTIEKEETTTIKVNMNLNNFYKNPNTYDFEDYSGIMSDSDAQQTLQENEHDVFSLTTIKN